MKRTGAMVMLVGILQVYAYAQTDSIRAVEELTEILSESNDTEPDEEEISHYLLLRRKINLNRLDPGDLSRIPFLTPRQIRNLTDYLNAYGDVYSMYELQAVAGFDSALILRLMAYLEIGPPPDRIKLTLPNLVRQGHHELVLRYQQVMQQQAGYNVTDSVRQVKPDGFYLGGPQRYYLRYRYAFSDRIAIGFSGDKDAGEEFFKGSQPCGMDFYSGFLSIHQIRWLKQFILGHFRVSFGQGLTIGGSSFGSWVSFGSTWRYFDGFRPSQSVSEYGYLRGGALTIRAGGFEGSAFASFARKDAAVIPGDTGTLVAPEFSSFRETGLHRTRKELENKNRINESVFGGHLSYRGRFFILGVTGYYGSWNGFVKTNDEAYRRFALRGSRFGALGIDGRCRVGWAQLFAEVSAGLQGGLAWLAGIGGVPVPGIDLLLVCRSYQPQYQNPFSCAIFQGGSASNEQGILIRLQTQLIPKITVTGFIDLFRFPWLRYRVNGPSTGVEAGILSQFLPSPWLTVLLKYTLAHGERNGTGTGTQIPPLTGTQRDEAKAQVDIGISPKIRSRSTIVFRTHRTGYQRRENGYLVSQEFGYTSSGYIRAVRISCALFDIPAYDARIYQREPDVLYSFSAPSHYGRGLRWVLLIRTNFFHWLELAGWAGITQYTDRTSIGTGLDQIEGKVRSEVKVQVRVKF